MHKIAKQQSADCSALQQTSACSFDIESELMGAKSPPDNSNKLLGPSSRRHDDGSGLQAQH